MTPRFLSPQGLRRLKATLRRLLWPEAQISTRIAIAAPVETVWQLLASPEAHLTWNPNLRHITGRFREGEAFTMSLGAAGARPVTFHPVVLSLRVRDHITWRGHLWLPGMFDGTHSLRVTSDGSGGTLFANDERFAGLLLRFIDVARFRPDFEAANAGLKRLAEDQTP